jgi:hypothetical protein
MAIQDSIVIQASILLTILFFINYIKMIKGYLVRVISLMQSPSCFHSFRRHMYPTAYRIASSIQEEYSSAILIRMFDHGQWTAAWERLEAAFNLVLTKLFNPITVAGIGALRYVPPAAAGFQ